MDKRKCLLCDEEFIPKSFNQSVCLNTHYFYCPICNSKFKASKDQIRNYIKNGVIGGCSYSCRNKMGIQKKIEKYGKANNGDKIHKTYRDMDTNLKQSYVDKVKQTKLERYGSSNYNNIEKNKQTKLERYGDEKYNNREKARVTILKNNDGVYRTKEQSSKMVKTKIKKYGKGNNGDKISKTLKNKSKEERQLITQKIKQTNLERYGTETFAQSLIPKQSLEILLNKNKFIQFCNEHINNLNFLNGAKLLDISPYCFSMYFYKYECDKIIKLRQLSYIEQDIRNLLDDYDIKYAHNTRSIISPLELDFYIPEYNLAIECNGTYWHSYNNLPDKNYHYNKSKLCEEKGIRLIHIWEYEWNNERQRPILENIIKNALNINEDKIYARKCKIVIKESKEMKEFFNKNNIQGFRPGKFAICLEYNNEIIMSYMMGSAFFSKGKYEWEVIRRSY